MPPKLRKEGARCVCVCGCGVVDSDSDSDNDGVLDCRDEYPNDIDKTVAGLCGCGDVDTDSDSDEFLRRGITLSFSWFLDWHFSGM
jgi:hypothetical protein